MPVVGNKTARKIIMAAAACVFVFSGSMVLRHSLQMRTGAQYAQAVAQLAVTLPAEESANQTAEQSAADADPGAPIQVDFDVLFAQNRDVVAWLYCPDTPINYPVVQGADNEYYLRRLLDGRSNASGTLFMDHRNAADWSDWNRVIYGHNMRNGSMFGTLTNYKDPTYFQAHPVMFLLTPERNYRINLLAGFVTAAHAQVYSEFSPGEEEKTELIGQWLEASDFDSGLFPAPEQRLITLSTCSYEYTDARYVLVGVLEECPDV